MKLTIEPTPEFTSIEGQPFRVWTGTDDNGTEVKAWVRAVQPQTDDETRLAAFEAELQSLPAAWPVAIDYRFIAD